MAKKICVESTLKLPARTSGLPKSARLSTKPMRKEFARPGRISGKVTVVKTRQRDARSVWAASSIDGLTPWTTPSSTMKAIGAKARV